MASASGSSSPEYATLEEMFGALVDNLASNADVIAPLNNHLLASGLISKAVFIAVQHPGPRATPYDRCSRMLTPVLSNVESDPACFNSLIESLEKVQLYDIVGKLKDKLKSRKRAYEGQKEKERNDAQTDSESTSTDEEVDPLLFPLVSIPPDLSYTTIGKMTEDLEFLSIDVAATILLDKKLSSLFAPSSSRPHLQQFCQQVFNYVKYHRRSYPPEVDEEPESEESEEKPHDLSPDDISRVFEVGIFFLAMLALFEAETETLKAAVSSEKQHKANLLHHASKHGWVSVIDILIKQHGFDPASTDAINQTAVHYAAKHAEYEAFKILVANHNCDPMCKNSKGETPLLFATESGSSEIVKYYMTLPLVCDGNTTYNGKSLGIIAAEHGHIYILKHLIKECNFNVQICSSEGNSALDLAARSGHIDIVKYLISECECDPNKTKNRWQLEDPKKPLHHASEKGHIDVVKYLVSDCKCDVHKGHDTHGSTPLQYATRNQHLELVKYFVLECSCDAEPALQYAAEQGNMDILEFLGKNCNKNSEYSICLEAAIKGKHTHVVKYLVDQWGKKEDLFNKLFEATRSRSYLKVDFLITDCKVDPTTIDSKGRTLLHYAAEDIYSMNGLLVVQSLLAAGLDPLKRDKKGDTPMAIAGKSANKKATKFFFEAFAKTKTTYPVDSYVNVLIVGNSGAGKSTLSKVIEKTGSSMPILARYVDKNEITPLTAGIVPINLKRHHQLQNIVLHDFAGQSQYYLSHTAVIENILQESAAVFIIVVDVSNSDYLIHLKQWLAVVRNEIQKAKDNCKVIVVASHVDCLNSEEESGMIRRNIKKELPRNDDVIVYLDCRRLNGADINSFLKNLQSACSYIRDNNKKSLTLYCHMMYKLLQENEKDILALNDIAHDAATKVGECFLPTHDGKQILRILSSLHSTGLIYYLNCEDGDEEVWTSDSSCIKTRQCRMWVVKNKEVLLKQVDGVLFSPFQESKIPNNGIITVSKLEKEFPEYDSVMLISFLESMGLCHMVSPFFLIQTNLVGKGQDIGLKDILCLFFPSSVTIERPVIPHEFVFGWYLKCTNLHDLFPQRFFNSLLLHFSMKYAVEEASRTRYSKFQCLFWKNGIKWTNKDGITTLLELVDENQCVIVLMSCGKGAEKSKMITLRRRLINDVLAIRGKYCPTLDTEAFVIDPDSLKYPIDKPTTRVVYCVENFIKLGKHKFINPTPETSKSRGKQVCDVLPYESDYANLSIFGGDEPNEKAGDGGNFRYPGIGSLNVKGRKKGELNIKDLNYVTETLRQNHFPDREWKSLGRQLGLDDSTLDDIDEEYGTLRERFEKCLHTWLKREDRTKQQDKSWASLAKAMHNIGQGEVAKKIRKEHQLNY